VAAACGGLVEGHPADAAVIGTGAGRIDIVVDDPPQPGVVLPIIRAAAATGMAGIRSMT